MKVLDDSNEVAFHSMFDQTVKIVITYSGSISYDSMKDHFDMHGVAFLIDEKKIIVVDGEVVKNEWFSPEHLQIIDAHEVGHLLISPQDLHENDVEKCADYVGFNLIKEKKLERAIDLYRSEYISRYGCSPEDDDELSYLIKNN